MSKEGTTDSFGLSSNRLPISASAVGYCTTRLSQFLRPLWATARRDCPNFCVRCGLLHDETVPISASDVGYCTARLSKFLRPISVGYCTARLSKFLRFCRLLNGEIVLISASAVGYCTARLSKFLRLIVQISASDCPDFWV